MTPLSPSWSKISTSDVLERMGSNHLERPAFECCREVIRLAGKNGLVKVELVWTTNYFTVGEGLGVEESVRQVSIRLKR